MKRRKMECAMVGVAAGLVLVMSGTLAIGSEKVLLQFAPTAASLAKKCAGGTKDGSFCAKDGDCPNNPGTCPAGTCVGGKTPGVVCTKDADCPDDIGTCSATGDEVGVLKSFKDSDLVKRLDLADPNMTAQQIADMIMGDVKTNLEAIYAKTWVTFTKDQTMAGITRTIDFPVGILDTTDHSFGFTVPGVFPRKAWVFPDEFELKTVWLPKPPALVEGDNKLTKDQVTKALSKTAAHELGHLFGLDEENKGRKVYKKVGEVGGKRHALKPSSGVMAQGTVVEDIAFKAACEKKLQKELGANAAASHKPAKKKDASWIGDKDDHGTNPEGKKDSPGGEAIILSQDIVHSPGEDAGTDVLLPQGETEYVFSFEEPLNVLRMDSAFLQIGLYNVGSGEISSLVLEDAPGGAITVDITSALTGLDLTGGRFTSILVDLEVFAPLATLKTVFMDSTAALRLTIAPVANGAISVDSVHLTFFSEPVPVGACVVSGSTNCLCDITEAECAAEGGTYAGDGATCPSGVCIPAASEWGLIALALLVLTAGTIVVGRLRRPAAA